MGGVGSDCKTDPWEKKKKTCISIQGRDSEFHLREHLAPERETYSTRRLGNISQKEVGRDLILAPVTALWIDVISCHTSVRLKCIRMWCKKKKNITTLVYFQLH